MHNIINFKTIRYKLTASGNIIQPILNYKLMRLVSILPLHKEQKEQLILNSNGILLFNNLIPIDPKHERKH